MIGYHGRSSWQARRRLGQMSRFTIRFVIVAAMSGSLWAVAEAGAGDLAPSFTRDIKGVLSNRCIRCHGPDPEGRAGGGDEGLRLDTFAGATADLGGHAAIVPGKPDESELIARITSTDPDVVMPPPDAGDPLSPRQVDLLKRWIASGAVYEPHWAYVPPKRPTTPEVKNTAWPKNDIDRFILARLEAEGLAAQPEADRATLARRLALDLTGLPPTPEEVDAFIADPAANAVETFVDRLLAHDGYGEHQARQWLDLARYADSAGYADDPQRTIWGWRDWVVRAFDANMPFDEFTIRQIAGDLLPQATLDDRIATAFHRNTLTNNEGGTIDEEFRTVAIVDRVNTTMSTWMGTTIACAQCHDHKYDPLSQKEYFQLYAILNNTADADRQNESPLAEIPWEPVDAQRAAIKREIAEIETGIPLLAKPAAKDRPEPPEFQPARKILDGLRTKLAATPAVTVPVLQELAGDKRRVTKIQLRGNWQNLGDEVAEGVPIAFSGPPVADAGRIDRLTLAKWLVDPANPLTARVVVNRIWERLFGIGIVSTSEEFGSQGELPSHPELLDWLAAELVARRWDTKAIQRLIVTSAAYRQTSKCPPDLVARDPENRLLGCGPRVRLSAEVIRDQALAASGLLSRKKGGPSVKPPQPNLGLSAAFGGGIDWQTSTGEDRYRRAIYTTWRRSNPYPSMATFDAPSREVCTVRRPRTNTPLQALVTLNDPAYVEAAQALARRMVREGGAAATDRAARGFRLVLARGPSSAEIERLVRLHDDAAADFRADPADAAKMATDPLGPIPAELGADAADLAAWTLVANVILNLDETFMCP
ncbi:MAG: PSD1 and planctomycete cytochrome C domain-containing protein [Planctomycetia bacterium]|nr:PSD1 and planctomycete cytochrome C domain-containing protein [Planctomycetia bacterium]